MGLISWLNSEHSFLNLEGKLQVLSSFVDLFCIDFLALFQVYFGDMYSFLIYGCLDKTVILCLHAKNEPSSLKKGNFSEYLKALI